MAEVEVTTEALWGNTRTLRKNLPLRVTVPIICDLKTFVAESSAEVTCPVLDVFT